MTTTNEPTAATPVVDVDIVRTVVRETTTMHDDSQIVWRRSTPRYEVECRLNDDWDPVDEDMLPHLVEGVRNGTISWLMAAGRDLPADPGRIAARAGPCVRWRRHELHGRRWRGPMPAPARAAARDVLRRA
jgi:hypothetical protein